MNPLALIAAGAANPFAILAIVLAIVLGSFGTGWMINGWRLNTTIAEIKAERSKEKADQATAAVADMNAAAERIRAAAEARDADVSTLNAKLDALRKDFRNAPKPALPTGCKPDPVRVRNLEAAIDAVNEAGSR